MREVLALLVELQEIDQSLRGLSVEKRKLGEVEKENAESLKVLDGFLEERLKRIADGREFLKERELDLKEAEAQIARSRARLSTITSQRELTALNKELEAARRATRQKSDELIKLLEELEGAEGDYAKKKQERVALIDEMGAVSKTIRKRISEQELELEELTKRRATVEKALPREYVSRYRRIYGARDGSAVVDVLEDGECSACHMRVPPQMYIRLQRMDAVECCVNCNRIVVFMKGVKPQQAETGVSE